jgi:hypothetical protein
VLLLCGATKYCRNKHGYSPAEEAEIHSKFETLQLLRNFKEVTPGGLDQFFYLHDVYYQEDLKNLLAAESSQQPSTRDKRGHREKLVFAEDADEEDDDSEADDDKIEEKVD